MKSPSKCHLENTTQGILQVSLVAATPRPNFNLQYDDVHRLKIYTKNMGILGEFDFNKGDGEPYIFFRENVKNPQLFATQIYMAFPQRTEKVEIETCKKYDTRP